MKYLPQIPFILFSMFAQGGELAMLTDLSDLTWKYRVIVVNQPENEANALALLKKHTAEVNDRDITWFIVKEDSVLTNYQGNLSKTFLSKTREKYGLGQSKVILIGKDGGIKARLDRLDIKAIFTEIDAMPMRQYEMQN